jgi:hypothetical protein
METISRSPFFLDNFTATVYFGQAGTAAGRSFVDESSYVLWLKNGLLLNLVFFVG